MIFSFTYRDEFYITCEAESEEEARHRVINGIGEMEIENFGDLWNDYLELVEEYDNNQEV